MRRLRWWLVSVLLDLARRTHPGTPPPYEYDKRVWQIIEVPRRISETEAAQLAQQVQNL